MLFHFRGQNYYYKNISFLSTTNVACINLSIEPTDKTPIDFLRDSINFNFPKIMRIGNNLYKSKFRILN